MKKTDIGVVLNITKGGNEEEPKLYADVMFENQTINIECKDEFFVAGNIVRYRLSKPSEKMRLATGISDAERSILESVYQKLATKLSKLQISIERRTENVVNASCNRAQKEVLSILQDQEKLNRWQERLTNFRTSLDQTQTITL